MYIIAEVEKVFCEISDQLNIQNFFALQNSSATGGDSWMSEQQVVLTRSGVGVGGGPDYITD